MAKVRPPYRSEWPLEIPAKEEVENRSGERDAIAHSVFRSDFNWYTMKPLDMWSATPIGEQGLRTNRSAYESFLDRLYNRDDPDELAAFRLVCPSPEEESSEPEPDDEARRQLEEMDREELRELVEKIDRQAEKSKDRALAAFVKKLPPKERGIFETEIAPYLRESDFDRNRPTTLTFSYNDSARWIYKSAYAFGWSKSLFEEFERNYCSQFSRNRPMLERMGKKYQYIALSELHARFSDHVKLLKTPSSTDVVSYEGPWQLRERDIDPSLLIDRTQDPGWGNPSLPVWWCPYQVGFSAELSVEELQDWLWSTEDIPDIQNLLTVESDGRRCTVLNTLWTVRQRDKRRIDSGLPIREVQARIRSAIVRRSDVGNLRAHILGARRSRSRSPGGKADLRDDTLFSTDRDISAFFLGEWPWHASTSEFWRDWTPAAEEQHWRGCPVPMVIPVVEYLRESGTGDMSLAETFSVWIPSKWLVGGLKLRITNGHELTFSDDKGRVVFCDPSVSEAGPSAALIDTETLAELLEREGLALVWAVGGEKNVYEPVFYGRHCFSGLYHWEGTGSGLSGNLWMWEERPDGGAHKVP